jgi:succinate dehydrogenase subunit C
MTHNTAYTPYHPRWHRTRVSTYWWLARGSYFLFILRELSSLAVAWCVVYLLMLISAVSAGADAYQQFLQWSRTPLALFMNIGSFVFLVLHSITWFNLAPQAMVVKVAGRRVPGFLIAGSNYAGWVVVSLAILGLLVIQW